MASNGFIPLSSLARIPGSGPFGSPRLLKSAARAYNAMHQEALRRFGVSMALHEGDVGRAYRSFPRQQLAKRVYGDNAATPGSSNHGWGLAVDLATRKQRWVVDKIGRKYGFSKACSDASWEWWHIKYNPSCTGATWKHKPNPYPTIRKGSNNGTAVRRLKRMLNRKGFNLDASNSSFNTNVKSAVKKFQKRKGMKADGVVGPKTWRALRK